MNHNSQKNGAIRHVRRQQNCPISLKQSSTKSFPHTQTNTHSHRPPPPPPSAPVPPRHFILSLPHPSPVLPPRVISSYLQRTLFRSWSNLRSDVLQSQGALLIRLILMAFP